MTVMVCGVGADDDAGKWWVVGVSGDAVVANVVVEGAAAEGAEGAEPNAAGDASAKTPEDKTKAPAENKKK